MNTHLVNARIVRPNKVKPGSLFLRHGTLAEDSPADA